MYATVRYTTIDVIMATYEELVNACLNMGYADAKIAKAMLSVDRKDFVGTNADLAYNDMPVPILNSQTTSAPSVIATTLTRLNIKYGMKILEIGTGSGYQTALLAKLVGGRGKVVSIERSKELFEFAKANLKKYKFKNIIQVLGNGAKGYPKKAPYDRIIYSAAVRRVPIETLEQLKPNGALVAPVGTFTQELLLVEKKNGKEVTTDLGPVVFSKIEDEEVERQEEQQQ